MSILNELRKNAFIDIIKKGKRLTDRDFFDYREINIEKDVIDTAAGSALVRIGETQVLAAIKFAVGEPYSDRPDEGVFSTNAEFVPFANPSFESGPPDENSIELARVVDRAIRSAEIVDVKSFVLDDGKVLMMFIDLWILDDQGNITDAAGLAAMGALLCTKIPKYENGVLVREGKLKDLAPKGIVTSHTFGKIADKLYVDAVLDEDVASEGKITYGVMDDKIVSVQKSGEAGFSKDELFEIMDIAFKKHSELKKILKGD
ncbi:exosome complex protein Rrp42 [Candidatus Micrarchaeota archaeon]|jgi:exosome complex component RRP42|nr:exosome complex protein Rrp42 [Candidatus Micrarchaeota archaeon]